MDNIITISHSEWDMILNYIDFLLNAENPCHKCPEIQKFISDNTNEYVKEINCSTYENITLKTKKIEIILFITFSSIFIS